MSAEVTMKKLFLSLEKKLYLQTKNIFCEKNCKTNTDNVMKMERVDNQ